MKLKKVLFLAAAVLVMFNACDKTIEPTGITLNEASLALETGEEETLVATLLPTGATGTVTWVSSNAEVATVENGKVTAVSPGTADVVAAIGSFQAKCVVTVTKPRPNFAATLTGTEYYPIVLDGVTAGKLGTKIIADFRPDEAKKNLWLWDGTFTAGTPAGPNCFGEVEPWTSLIVGSVGWSGAGFNCLDGTLLDKLVPVTANPDKYYLHIGIKSKSNTVYVFGLDGQSGVKFAVGATAFNDNGTLIQPLADFDRDGEWQQIEIPMTTLKTNGLLYSVGATDKNVLWFLAGGIAGTTIDLDAVFIYKKQ